MNRDPDNQPERTSPLRLIFAKAVQSSTRIKVAVVLAIALACGMARLSYLQSESSVEAISPPVSTNINETPTTQTEAVSDEPLIAAQTAIGLEELPAQLTTPQETPPPPSLNSDDREQSSPDWIFAILGLGLAVICGIKVAAWTEKNGYNMKRFEDWANKKSGKKNDKDDPKP